MLFEPPIQIPTPVRIVPVIYSSGGRGQEHELGVTPPPVSRSEPVDEIRSILFHKAAGTARKRIALGQSVDWSGHAAEAEEIAPEECLDDDSDEGESEEDVVVYEPPTFSFDLPQYEPSVSPCPPDRCRNPIVHNKGFLSDFGGALGTRVTPKCALDVQGAELGLLSLSPPRQALRAARV